MMNSSFSLGTSNNVLGQLLSCVSVPLIETKLGHLIIVLYKHLPCFSLICRGKVLKDDTLLSTYHVEDGHTLHLVVRQPIPPSSKGLPDHPESDSQRRAINMKKRSFRESNLILNLGGQDKKCGCCEAMVWATEFTGRYVGTTPKGYSICCGKGKVQLPLLQETPPELLGLLTLICATANSTF